MLCLLSVLPVGVLENLLRNACNHKSTKLYFEARGRIRMVVLFFAQYGVTA